MDIILIAPPNDSMWWILRPEFIAYIDKIILDEKQFEKEKEERFRSGYHKLVWDRLSILGNEGILDITQIKLPEQEIKTKVKLILDKIFSTPELLNNLTNDMIFAYKYWINFNKLKIKLLPKGQKYRNEILKLLPLWENDLDLLIKKREKAFFEEPKIVDPSIYNILQKSLELKILNHTYKKCAFSSLREYEPFMKYIEMDDEIVLVPDSTSLTYKNKMVTVNELVELPVEPDFNFLKFSLSELSFKKKLMNIINDYKKPKEKLRDLINKTEDLLFDLKELRFKTNYTRDLHIINKELKELSNKIKQRSKYFSLAFSGLSLLPIPVISQIFSLFSLSSRKIFDFIESYQLSIRALSPNGLSAYYAFLESNINIKQLDEFPKIEEENNKLSGDFFDDPFWRV